MSDFNHAKYLGYLVSNFQSLEFALRAFLSRQPGARPCAVPYGVDIYTSAIGTELPECDLTSFDTLGELMGKFNAKMRNLGFKELDSGMVNLRDALAHGRVSSAEQDSHMRLLKFSKPQNGRVKVTFNEEMTEEWFKARIQEVAGAITYVQSRLSP